MRKVQYGARTIEYYIKEQAGLKAHYITVDRDSGVVLKGKPISPSSADKLVLKKASWILDKLLLVGNTEEDELVTGSRLPYLGKSYYVELVIKPELNKVAVEFNYSRFRIQLPDRNTGQAHIRTAVEEFYKIKAVEKIAPRVEHIAARTRLPYNGLSFRKMSKRWGSCTPGNKIILNPDAVKLSFRLIDYLIIHELCHTRVKDHSRAFRALLSRKLPDWRELDERMKKIGGGLAGQFD